MGALPHLLRQGAEEGLCAVASHLIQVLERSINRA